MEQQLLPSYMQGICRLHPVEQDEERMVSSNHGSLRPAYIVLRLKSLSDAVCLFCACNCFASPLPVVITFIAHTYVLEYWLGTY